MRVVGPFDFQACAGFASSTPAPPSIGHCRLLAAFSSLSSLSRLFSFCWPPAVFKFSSFLRGT